jgi:hypothetical protein
MDSYWTSVIQMLFPPWYCETWNRAAPEFTSELKRAQAS